MICPPPAPAGREVVRIECENAVPVACIGKPDQHRLGQSAVVGLRPQASAPTQLHFAFIVLGNAVDQYQIAAHVAACRLG